MAGRQVAENDSLWLKNMLATFYGETDHFKDPRLLLDVAHKIQLRQKLAPQTMITYLACLKKFINYLVMRDGINGSGILAAVGIAKASFSSAAASESRQKATDRFKRVPSHGMVVKRHGQVIEILQQNLEEELLLLKEEKALNFFLMQCRLNCRSQPILLLTWTALVEIKQKGIILTNRHKTGQYYDVAIRVQDDQFKFLDHLKQTYMQELGQIPDLIFGTKKGTQDRSLAREITATFAAKFGDNPNDVRFNANSMRKYREVRMQELSQKQVITPAVLSEHLHQTGHTQQTAEKHYMTANVQNRIQLLNHLVNDLYTVPEAEEVTASLPPSPPPPALPPNDTTDTNDTIGDATTLEERQARQKKVEVAERSKLNLEISEYEMYWNFLNGIVCNSLIEKKRNDNGRNIGIS